MIGTKVQLQQIIKVTRYFNNFRFSLQLSSDYTVAEIVYKALQAPV